MFDHGFIEVHDANQNNLQHVNVKIPKDAISVFVGRSGSGKSSLVFDTIAAESRRELNETFPSFTQQYLPKYGQPDPITYLAQIQNAGSVFLGQNAAEPVGDYVAGPNHVLPTAGSARFFSPLGVYDFVKRTQFIQYSSEALASQADAIVTLAQAEGLDGHAEAIIKRVPAAKEV